MGKPLRSQGLEPEKSEGNKPPGKPHDHAAVDDPAPGLGKKPHQDDQDNDTRGHGNRRNPPTARRMEIGHAEQGGEKRMEPVVMSEQVARPRGYTRRKGLLEGEISLEVGHEKDHEDKGDPVVPEKVVGKGVNSQRRKPVYGAGKEEDDPR